MANAAGPITTIVPFSTLPACAQACGPLFDANGACVPPAAPTAAASVYENCFCSYAPLRAFSTGSTGVCDTACTADEGGLGSIQKWFTGLCNVDNAAKAQTSSSAGSQSTSAAGSASKSGGGSWLSTHWKWVIMLVILVVGIAGIWVGACIWRRHYLKKKDRQYQLGKSLANRSSGIYNGTDSIRGSTMSGTVSGPGVFATAPVGPGLVDEEKQKPKKEKKKWTVTERT